MAFQAMVRPLTLEFPFIPVHYETCVFSTMTPQRVFGVCPEVHGLEARATFLRSHLNVE